MVLASLAMHSAAAESRALPSQAPDPAKRAKADHWLSGNINNITTMRGAMLIMLDTGVPDNCQGTPYGWMLIRQEDRVVVNMVMAMWASERRNATVYTVGMVDGWCEVQQIDPAG